MSDAEDPSDEDDAFLSNPQLLRVETKKVREYLLNLDHPIGGPKAKFFKEVGFSEADVARFVQALRTHAADNKIARVVAHTHGVKTVIECLMPTPSGKAYCIRSVWNDHQDGEPPKLITALPLPA